MALHASEMQKGRGLPRVETGYLEVFNVKRKASCKAFTWGQVAGTWVFPLQIK